MAREEDRSTSCSVPSRETCRNFSEIPTGEQCTVEPGGLCTIHFTKLTRA